jgi:hypothetical protein
MASNKLINGSRVSEQSRFARDRRNQKSGRDVDAKHIAGKGGIGIGHLDADR